MRLDSQQSITNNLISHIFRLHSHDSHHRIIHHITVLRTANTTLASQAGNTKWVSQAVAVWWLQCVCLVVSYGGQVRVEWVVPSVQVHGGSHRQSRPRSCSTAQPQDQNHMYHRAFLPRRRLARQTRKSPLLL
jgi:hypothetical protein